MSHILAKHRDSRRPSSWRQEHITISKDEALHKIQRLTAGNVQCVYSIHTQVFARRLCRGARRLPRLHRCVRVTRAHA